MTITMADSALNNQLPQGWAAYAAYVDGHVGNQPNYSYITTAFPRAFHLSISVFGNNADCLDIESGAATVSSAANWYRAQIARGVTRPVFYASVSTMEADLIPAINAAGIPRSQYRLWSAHYDAGQHICGPASCRQMSIPADGTQWGDTINGANADISLLQADFFNANPTISQGATGTPVVMCQERLNVWGDKVTVDGIFGTATTAAVKAFQTAQHITVDGVVGTVTWAKLNAAPPVTDPPYPAPGNLHIGGVALTLNWDPVVVTGAAISSYSVKVVQLNGKVAANQTTPTNSCLVNGLISGWTYDVFVWANGGSKAPPHATLQVVA